MKALLMHRDKDFGPEQRLPDHADVLSQDLETLLQAMAGGDGFLHGIARTALLAGFAKYSNYDGSV